jgi:hypothetical protein
MQHETLIIAQTLGTLLAALLILAAILWAGKQTILQGRGLWLALRGKTPALISAIDQPADPMIAQLSTATRIPAEVWAAFLPAFIQALASGLDAALLDHQS